MTKRRQLPIPMGRRQAWSRFENDDIYLEVAEPFRRRGFGAWLVQELKSAAYELGAIPGARCSPMNIPSRSTLQKSGFVPFAHMLTGVIGRATP